MEELAFAVEEQHTLRLKIDELQQNVEALRKEKQAEIEGRELAERKFKQEKTEKEAVIKEKHKYVAKSIAIAERLKEVLVDRQKIRDSCTAIEKDNRFLRGKMRVINTEIKLAREEKKCSGVEINFARELKSSLERSAG